MAEFESAKTHRFERIMDLLHGESRTVKIRGPSKMRTVVLKSPHTSDIPMTTVVSTRLVFKTIYRRLWMPSKSRSLYRVEIYVPEELRNRYPEDFFSPVTYPTLCSRWFQWSSYPHLKAITAYLDRLAERMRGEYYPVPSV